MKIIGKFSMALVALAIGLTQKTVADAVVDWNVIASQAIAAGARQRTLGLGRSRSGNCIYGLEYQLRGRRFA